MLGTRTTDLSTDLQTHQLHSLLRRLDPTENTRTTHKQPGAHTSSPQPLHTYHTTQSPDTPAPCPWYRQDAHPRLHSNTPTTHVHTAQRHPHTANTMGTLPPRTPTTHKKHTGASTHCRHDARKGAKNHVVISEGSWNELPVPRGSCTHSRGPGQRGRRERASSGSPEAQPAQRPHLLAGGTEVGQRDAVVSEAGVGPTVLGEDLLRGEARLEPAGRWPPRAWERQTQVGLQLGLQVLEEGDRGLRPLRQPPGQPRKARACHGQDQSWRSCSPLPLPEPQEPRAREMAK